MIIVVMGVSGAGKSTIGRRLAAALDAKFVEGDEYHPANNVAKMQQGTALSDADRWPWLDSMAAAIEDWHASGQDVVLACSALKRRYRRHLQGDLADIHFLHLAGSMALINERLETRSAHFMPASLLASQFDDLETPQADEPAIQVAISAPPEQIVAEALELLSVAKSLTR